MDYKEEILWRDGLKDDPVIINRCCPGCESWKSKLNKAIELIDELIIEFDYAETNRIKDIHAVNEKAILKRKDNAIQQYKSRAKELNK